MATITFTRISVCAAGDHVTIDVSFNGGASKRGVFDIDDLRQALSILTPEEQEAFAKLVLRVHIAGKTRNQITTEFNSPVTVTI